MNVLAIDTENNTWNTGAPFDRRFKGVCHSWADSDGSGAAKNNEESLAELAERIGRADILVGFNLKYDLHVLRKLGVGGWEGAERRLWDCQLAEYVRSNQTWKYPSLAETAERYGLPVKLDVVASQYWQKGIQTEDIPWKVLEEYAVRDAELTKEIFECQSLLMTDKQKQLVRLMSLDLLVLEEMEWNGIKFDEELCRSRAEDIRNQISQITERLRGVYPSIPISFTSGDDLSAFLYGGTVVEEQREIIGFYKTGAKIGQPRYRINKIEHQLPRLVEPIRGSELKKQGFFATNADTLLKLKPSKKTREIIELIQKQTRLETLLSKTYDGLVKKHTEQNWEPGYLHGQFNQVTVSTGRLSSSGPNLQNLDSEANDLFISRYTE